MGGWVGGWQHLVACWECVLQACKPCVAHRLPLLPPTPHTLEVSAPEDFGAFDGKGRLQVPGFPPTALVVMERDGSLGRARAAVEGLQAAGVPAGVLVVRFGGCLWVCLWVWRCTCGLRGLSRPASVNLPRLTDPRPLHPLTCTCSRLCAM